MLSALIFFFFFLWGKNNTMVLHTPDVDSSWPESHEKNTQPMPLKQCLRTVCPCRVIQLWWHFRKTYCVRKRIQYSCKFTNKISENGAPLESQSPTCAWAWCYWNTRISNFPFLLLNCHFSNQNQPSFIIFLNPISVKLLFNLACSTGCLYQAG